MEEFKILSFLIDRSMNHTYCEVLRYTYQKLAYCYKQAVEAKGTEWFDKEYNALINAIHYSPVSNSESLWLQKKLSTGL